MTKTYHIPTAPTSPIRKPGPHLDLRDFGITLTGRCTCGRRAAVLQSQRQTNGHDSARITFFHRLSGYG